LPFPIRLQREQLMRIEDQRRLMAMIDADEGGMT
jgi:hypothetical protein